MVDPKIRVKNLSVSFDKVTSLKNVSLDIEAHEILSIIGPANSGKTTFLKMLNRLNDFEPALVMSGEVLMDGKNIYRDFDPVILRRKVGVIFALPIPLPITSNFGKKTFSARRPPGLRWRRAQARAASWSSRVCMC